jgi:hypothetical protein
VETGAAGHCTGPSSARAVLESHANGAHSTGSSTSNTSSRRRVDRATRPWSPPTETSPNRPTQAEQFAPELTRPGTVEAMNRCPARRRPADETGATVSVSGTRQGPLHSEANQLGGRAFSRPPARPLHATNQAAACAPSHSSGHSVRCGEASKVRFLDHGRRLHD